jgi:hypothetical protein
MAASLSLYCELQGRQAVQCKQQGAGQQTAVFSWRARKKHANSTVYEGHAGDTAHSLIICWRDTSQHAQNLAQYPWQMGYGTHDTEAGVTLQPQDMHMGSTQAADAFAPHHMHTVDH